jgi:hypothetical protein
MPVLPSSPLSSGRRLGPLVIGEVLAEGVRSVTCRAEDPATGSACVVKALRPGAGDPARFRMVGEVLATVDHPGLVRVRRVGEDDGLVYLVMDPVEGRTLAQAAHDGTLPADDRALRRLLSRLLDALYRLHVSGLLHRDVSPANIVVGADGTPVLIDVDAATPAEAATPDDATALVTPGFAAPECFERAGREGAWTDLYGLGAVAYWIVAGKVPDDAGRRRAGDRLAPAVEVGRGRYGEALLRSIDRALSLDPALRPLSAKAWALALTTADTVRPLPAGAPVPGPAIAADDVPPTIAFARRPAATRRPAAVSGDEFAAGTPAPQRRRRPAVVVAALLLAAMALSIGGWRGWIYYLENIKSEWIVDAGGDGDATTIGEALRRARDGAVIRVRPGRYAEPLVMERPHRLVGDGGDASAVVIAGDGDAPCLRLAAAGAGVRGVSFNAGAAPGADGAACVDVATSGVAVEDSVITNLGGPGLRIGGDVEAEIRGNRIADTGGAGIVVEGRAKPTLADNVVTGTARSAIVVRGEARPLVTGHRIAKAGGAGILVLDGGGGVFRDNHIAGTARSGIEVRAGGAPTFAGNRIETTAEAGVYVDDGGGRFENNVIVGSALSGVVVGGGGEPEFIANRIEGGRQHGVLALAGAKGRFERNVVTGNAGHGIARDETATTVFSDNEVSGNRDPQIHSGRTPASPADGPGR